MDLSQTAADLKAHFESVVSTGEQFLAEHIPGLAGLAEKLAGDPLVQVVIDDTVPAPLRPIAAAFLKDLAGAFPAPAAEAAPAEPAPEPEPEPEPVPVADAPPAG